MNYGPFDTLMFCGLAQNNRKLSGLNLFFVRLLNVASKSSQFAYFRCHCETSHKKHRTPQQKRATVCGKLVCLCVCGSLCQKKNKQKNSVEKSVSFILMQFFFTLI